MRRRHPIFSPALARALPLAVALLAAAPVLAAGPAPTPVAATAPMGHFVPPDQAPLFAALAPAPARAAHGGDVGNPGALGTCVADCWDGSHVTCTGSSCSEVDSSCGAGQRGYCYGTDTGYRYCPVCQGGSCHAETTCSGGGSVSCDGGPGCFSVYHCYAYCDDQYHLCPNATNCPF